MINDPKTFINNLINNLSIHVICVNIIMYNYKN